MVTVPGAVHVPLSGPSLSGLRRVTESDSAWNVVIPPMNAPVRLTRPFVVRDMASGPPSVGAIAGGMTLKDTHGTILFEWPTDSCLMDIEKKVTGDTLEMLLSGRIDGAAANELEIEVLAVMRQPFKSVYVNLAQATFLCSAGIRVLLQYHRQMKNKGLTFLVTRPSPEVSSALEMTGFPELVEPE